MAFFTGWATKLTAFLTQNVGATAIILTKADGSPDMAQSNGLGGFVVADSSAVQPTIYTAVTPADATDLAALATKGLLIGGSGNLAVRMMGALGTTITLAVQPGQFVPGQFSRVMAATTATGIVALS